VKVDLGKSIWWSVLLIGLVLTGGGLFGVWIQGAFYHGGFPTAATLDEVRNAFTLPTALTTGGALIVSSIILASPLTASWHVHRRLTILVCFGVLLLVACGVCGCLASNRVAPILK
jgi:hypothetical protein